MKKLQKYDSKELALRSSKFSNISPESLLKSKVSSEDFYMEDDSKEHLGFFTKVETRTTLTVPIDQEFHSPSYYRHVVAAINDLTEEDKIVFEINSDGGSAAGLIALLSAIERSPAISIAVINGMAASAASILALRCDVCLLTDNAAMMCHNASFSTGGKSFDVASHVSFERKRSDDLMRKTYEYFLEEHEIEDLLKGIEFWFDAEEISSRLAMRDEIREIIMSEEEEGEDTQEQITFPELEVEEAKEEEEVKPKKGKKVVSTN